MRGLHIGLTILLGLVVLWPLQAKEADVDVVGVYLCEGLNAEGNPYHAFVEITKVEDDERLLHLHWTFSSDDDEETFGVGFVSAGVLVVNYHSEHIAGLAVYKIAGEKLVGEWAASGSDGVHQETLTRASQHLPTVKGDPKKLKKG